MFTCSVLCMENNNWTTIFHSLFSYRSQKWCQNVQKSSGTTSRRRAASFELLMSFQWSIIVPTMKNCRFFFSIILTSVSDDVSREIITCRAGVGGIFIYWFFFLTKAQRYIDGGRHLKSNVQDSGDSTIVRTSKYAYFAGYNRRQNCWDNGTI